MEIEPESELEIIKKPSILRRFFIAIKLTWAFINGSYIFMGQVFTFIGRLFLILDNISTVGLRISETLDTKAEAYEKESMAKIAIEQKELEAELKAIVEEYGLNLEEDTKDTKEQLKSIEEDKP